ncbi:MAG: amylo-alpha-1,6-glucosidase [Blastocatellia bacterium]
MIESGRDVCSDLTKASQLEWLETNGLGGFASSTIAGINTRRYHGLLVAAIKPPVVRTALLAKLEETLVIDGQRYELSANQYPGVVHPQGYQFLKRFRLDPFPVFTYEVAGLELEKSVLMVHGENTTVIQYEIIGHTARSVSLELRPLIAFRDYHSLTHENGALNAAVQTAAGLATVMPYAGLPALHFAHEADEIELAGWWYRNFEYAIERERGLEFREDLFSPFALKSDLTRRQSVSIIASTEQREAAQAMSLRQAEIRRRMAVTAMAAVDDELVRTLTAAADQFIVARGDHKTIIAGYHWFSDWGRDTMIALPGLTLAVGRADAARDILLEFSRYVDQGMLPNRFPDAGEAPEYNTVDATLWFFEAVRQLIAYTGDEDFVREHLYEVLKEIIAWHERGTRYGIRVDDNGLLHSGEAGVQLTWMDAKIGDWVVTPRQGLAVEIQALWYNALCVMKELAMKFDDPASEKKYRRMAARAKRSFNQLFWNEAAGCLYDVIDDAMRDAAIRPNQILAASLEHSMLARERAKQVVAVVERELLTPVGLRSLAPGSPDYKPRYEGGIFERDGAYHQGTVWAWLMGPFITAYIKANGDTGKAREQARQWLDSFQAHIFSEACLGQVAEIFDADAPHAARGCAAQAWSVAELLRAAVEDVYAVAPTHGANKSARLKGSSARADKIVKPRRR